MNSRPHDPEGESSEPAITEGVIRRQSLIAAV
jgi:hypothetical protein